MVNRFLRPLVQTLLSVLVIASLALTVLLYGLQSVVFDESLYRDLPEEPTFIEGMTSYVLDDLEAECLFYGLPFDTVKTVVTEEWIRTLSQAYTTKVYAKLCNGGDDVVFTVDPAPYRAVLDTFFASLPEEERPLDENAAATLSQELADSTAQVLSGGLIGSLLGYGHRFVYGDTLLRRLASCAGWALAATVVFVALSLLPWGGWRRRLYGTAGSLFIGAALVAVPLELLRQHRLADRLALGNSPLKLYADGVLNGLIGGLADLSVGVLLGCAVLLIAAVVVMVWKRNEEKQ